MTPESIQTFVSYVGTLKGDEKGEAQVFCDRLFQAFGHAGYKEAGAILEDRVKRKGRGTGFADLSWRPRMLMEMKSRGEKLQRHYQQAFEYWTNMVPDRPRYVVLCNFDEFWIYDFNTQLHDPVDRISIHELVDRAQAFNFMRPIEQEPLFENNRVKVTREAADKVAHVFNEMVSRGENPKRAQKFILQCVVAMFAEDCKLLPDALFTKLLKECVEQKGNTYDLIGSLFTQMNSPSPARGGRFQGVEYFNGGLFDVIEPVELSETETKLLYDAAREKWDKVDPPIFGTLFQSSMNADKRHAMGAHFTNEADIQKVILPTIVKPWRARIEKANTLKELTSLAEKLLKVRVLDPACGSGNFLYVAYRELMNLEMEILAKIHEKFGERAKKAVGTASLVSTTQFFGIDIDEFAVELAKVTLMLGKRIALAEVEGSWFDRSGELPFEFERPLPLDNLDESIVCDDALFVDWPKADYIVGNPPFQSKNKMQEEFGLAYVNRVREAFPDISGLADFCVYWFRKSHDCLEKGQRAGLVGTNTVRQTYSRESGLDYILENDGTITDAVATQVWSGDAVVHVSIVNWIRGKSGLKESPLRTQMGDDRDSPWKIENVKVIPSSLSSDFDVSKSKKLTTNARSKVCYQGQTPGHEGFLLSNEEAETLISKDATLRDVLFPYLTGDDLLSTFPSHPQRHVIDFQQQPVNSAAKYSAAFELVKSKVLGDREKAAAKESERNSEVLESDPTARINKHHANFLNKWWQLSYARKALLSQIGGLSRYIVCSRVTKRPIFDFICSDIRPSDALQVFAVEDDYSFGIFQSTLHWRWFLSRCSTLKSDFRYTSNTVFDSFAWPQQPSLASIRAVAKAAVALRECRSSIMTDNKWDLRELYRTLELPGDNPLKKCQERLDAEVEKAFSFPANSDPLEQLFLLNLKVAKKEEAGEQVVGPGLPAIAVGENLVSGDSVRPR
ncbi:SAM-dependent methyltransferase [Rhodopirellula rubra]|uniref:site-specific DNA-methyltransferase (adenine-specific) n=1 Tax=Aporhodopirellula rubra TaxID=980271 RepID=A0A7W5E2F0_9BACT|nr:DNA methyltransferase [Aporhodopirellula rubra]MBB3208921.1 SAM-dependent methyltransferase [Aporhodopirellula rubra]